MAKKFIDAEYFINKTQKCIKMLEEQQSNFSKTIDQVVNTTQIEALQAVLEMIDNLPAADVQEVRHGKWIYTAFYGCNLATVKCSICDYQCTTTKDIAVEICDFNYCSECGAKMDGEE